MLVGLAGIGLLSLGLLMLFELEISLFRSTTFDRDFTGAVCGTPLDNPGWTTGSPCHGAVNRQTGAGWLTVITGLSCLVVAARLAVQRRRETARPSIDTGLRRHEADAPAQHP